MIPDWLVKEWNLEAVKPARNELKQKEQSMVVVSKKSGGGTFTPHPEGQFAGVCVDVHDLGEVETTWQGETKKQYKIDIYFYCGENKTLDNGETIPLLVRERFTATLSDKGRLKPFLTSWRGKRFTEEEENGFETDDLIGAPALLTVEHNESGDKVFANIVAVSKLPKQMVADAPKTPEGFVRIKDREQKQDEPATAPAGPFNDDDSDLPF